MPIFTGTFQRVNPNLVAFGTATEESPAGLGFDADNQILGMIGSTNDLFYRVDRKTSIATPVDPNVVRFGIGEARPTGLTWHTDYGWLMTGRSTDALLRLNGETGVAESVNPNLDAFGVGATNPTGLSFHKGKLYLSDRQTDCIYEISPTDSTVIRMVVDTATVGEFNPTDMCSDGTNLYLVGTRTHLLFIVDVDAGTITAVDPDIVDFNADEGSPMGLEFDGTDMFMAGSAHDALYRAVQTTLKQFSYRGNPIALKVRIHNVDVTDDLASVDDTSQSVDYPNLTEFRVGEASFTLRDVHGDYSPNNASNFFTQNGGRRTGYHAPVKIEAGFIVDGQRHTQTIFQGNIIRLVQDATPATVKVVCSDNFGDMRTKGIADFGVPRHFMLTEDPTQSAENGFYPILRAILPASHGSATLKRRVNDTPIAPVQKLQTEGTLDPKNFIIDDRGVHTEGGFIVNRGIGYPQLRMKSPYRYRHINDVVTDILNHAGITKSDVFIPERDVAAHFSSNGRVNYDLIGNIGSGNPVTWNGYVTDFLHDSGKWYFLYNKHRGNPNGISQVIEYDTRTRTYSQLHKFASATEVWKFTKAGDNLYILATTGGNYDANETSSENQIIQLDITGPTETVFVAHTVSLRPQLAHYYAGVGSVFLRPDSRRQLIYRENDGLYYAYVDRGNSQFGVAKATAPGATTAIITMNMDDYENHGGIGLDISGRTLLGGMTFLSGGRSQTLAFQKSL